MNLTFDSHLLYFKQPFKIAHGVRSFTDIVIVQLEHDGLIGFGEASLPPYLEETPKTVYLFLKKVATFLRNINDPFDVEFILNTVDNFAPANTAAKAAVDIALHDLIGKISEKSCREFLKIKLQEVPDTSYTIGIDTPEIIKNKVDEAKNFKILKVKLDGKNDQLIINTIRSLTNKPIAVDVNQGWSDKHQALEMIAWLAEKNVLFVEQPLSKNKLDDAAWLFEKSPLPIFADESIQRISDLGKIKNCFHGINIKLMKCTGMREAFQMIQAARILNLKVLIGCMTETSCAVSAAAQLSSLADYVDLDSPLLVKNDFFEGLEYTNGKIVLSDCFGLGVKRVGG